VDAFGRATRGLLACGLGILRQQFARTEEARRALLFFHAVLFVSAPRLPADRLRGIFLLTLAPATAFRSLSTHRDPPADGFRKDCGHRVASKFQMR